MWKLRLEHPFGGYGYYVIPGSLLFAATGVLFGGKTPMLLLALLTPGIIVHLFQYYAPDAKKKSSAACSPDWRELTPEEYEQVVSIQTRGSFAVLLFILVQLPILWISIDSRHSYSHARSFNGDLFFRLEVIAGVLTAADYLIKKLKAGKWENLDATARIAEVPVDETFAVTIHGKYSTEYKPYYVFYLPEGKFIADSSELFTGRSVRIVRWGSSCIFLPEKKTGSE
ncbi:MAG: hypothetical protein J5501_06935 [Ruminococcus sp.]|nr:hypothetical protein [Ruminococcus sp.]